MNLSTFLIKYGIRTISNFQLRHIFNDLNISGKVLMRDELNKIKSTKKSNIIMNLQTSKDNGSHWVVILKSIGLQYYFDPYGVLLTREVYEYLDKLFSWNKIKVQQDGMECCGQLSMYFLYRINLTDEKTDENGIDYSPYEIILSMKHELLYLQFLA